MSNIETLINQVDQVEQEIFKLNQTISAKLASLNEKKQGYQTLLNGEITTLARKELKAKKYGCGTANLDLPMYKIKVTVSKKVKWDEKELKAIANKIKEAGQEPENFIKYKLSVSETAFNGFTEDVQDAFMSARSVEASDPKIKIERK